MIDTQNVIYEQLSSPLLPHLVSVSLSHTHSHTHTYTRVVNCTHATPKLSHTLFIIKLYQSNVYTYLFIPSVKFHKNTTTITNSE